MSETKDAKHIVVEALNEARGLALTPEVVSFGEPVLLDPTVTNTSDPEIRNSEVRVYRDEDASGPAMDFQVRYNRLDLQRLFAFRELSFPDEGEGTTHDLLQKVFSLQPFPTTTADIQETTITRRAGVPVTDVQIQAAAESLAFMGQVTIKLISDGPVAPPSEPVDFYGDGWIETTDWSTTADPSMTSQPRTEGSTIMNSDFSGSGKMLTFDFRIDGDGDVSYPDYLELGVGNGMYWLQPAPLTGKHTMYLPDGDSTVYWDFYKESYNETEVGQAWVSNARLQDAVDIPGGFYVSNNRWSMAALSKDEQISSAIEPLPYLSPSHNAAIATGPNGQIMALDGSSSNSTLYYSDNWGRSWHKETIPHRLRHEAMVFFQGYAYVILTDGPDIIRALYRIIPVEGESGLAHRMEYVLDITSPTQNLVASDTHIALVDGDDLIYSRNGVDWTRRVLTHPFEVTDGSTPAVSSPRITLVDDHIYGFGYAVPLVDSSLHVAFFSGPIEGELVWKDTMPYGGSNWSLDSSRSAIWAVGEDLFLYYSQTYDYDEEWNEIGEVGSVYLSTDKGETWSKVLANPGITAGVLSVDGDRMLLSGVTDRYHTTSSKASSAWSNDKGRTWELDHSELSLTGWTKHNGTYACARVLIPEPTAERTSVPVLNPELDGMKIQMDATPSSMAAHLYDDGSLLIGHVQTYINGTLRRCMSHVGPDGELIGDFNVTLRNGSAYAAPTKITALPGGKFLVAGYFNQANGATVNNLVCLNADGTTDTTFNLPTFTWDTSGQTLTSMLVQPDGKILVAGNFLAVNGVERHAIARLNPDGTLDLSFTSEVTKPAIVYLNMSEIFLLSNGQIVGSGTSTSVNQAFLLNPDGSRDTRMEFGSKSLIRGIIEAPGGGYIISGSALAPTGAPNPNLLKVNSAWTVDPSFVPDEEAISPSPHRLIRYNDDVYVHAGTMNFPDGSQRTQLRFFDASGKHLPDFSGVNIANISSPYVHFLQEQDTAVYVVGSVRYVTQAEWPRTHLARRDAFFKFYPKGGQLG